MVKLVFKSAGQNLTLFFMRISYFSNIFVCCAKRPIFFICATGNEMRFYMICGWLCLKCALRINMSRRHAYAGP